MSVTLPHMCHFDTLLCKASLRHSVISPMHHFVTKVTPFRSPLQKNVTSPLKSDFGKNWKIYRLTIFCPSHAFSAKWFICEVNVNVTLVRRSDAYSKYNWLINKWSKYLNCDIFTLLDLWLSCCSNHKI